MSHETRRTGALEFFESARPAGAITDYITVAAAAEFAEMWAMASAVPESTAVASQSDGEPISAKSFYKEWIAAHPKMLGKTVYWEPGSSVSIFEFAEAYAEARAGAHPQPTDDYTESVYQALRQQMLREVGFWQGEHARVVADMNQLKDRILNVLDELTPEDADASHPVAIAYQKVADILNGAHPSLGEAAQPFWRPLSESPKCTGDYLVARFTDKGKALNLFVVGLKFYTTECGWRDAEGMTHWAVIPELPDAPQTEGKA
jgi:hypothetical protein